MDTLEGSEGTSGEGDSPFVSSSSWAAGKRDIERQLERELECVIISADEKDTPPSEQTDAAVSSSPDSSDSSDGIEATTKQRRAQPPGRRGRGRRRGQKGGGAIVSRSALRRQPPDPFSTSKLRIAPGEKNAFDIMQKAQKRVQMKRPHSPTEIISVSEQPRAKRQKGDDSDDSDEKTQQLTTAGSSKKSSGLRSDVWKWFTETSINNVRHGICIVEMADGKACGTKIRSAGSTTLLWRHLRTDHGYSKKSQRVSLTNVCSVRSN